MALIRYWKTSLPLTRALYYKYVVAFCMIFTVDIVWMNDFVLNDFVRGTKSKVCRVEKLPLTVCSFISQGNRLEEAKSNFENLVNNKVEFYYPCGQNTALDRMWNLQNVITTETSSNLCFSQFHFLMWSVLKLFAIVHHAS